MKKRILISVILFAIPFLFVYLTGAFVAVDFNMANWAQEGRVIIGIIAGCASFGLIIGYNEDLFK